MSDKQWEEYKKMYKGLSDINTNRGSSSNGLKGFIVEDVNATERNLERAKKGVEAREVVVNNNGPNDAIIRYKDGRYGRQIQEKCGYKFANYKKWLSEGSYDGMILSVNPDNPIWKNPEQLEQLKKLAKEHNVKLQKGTITNAEAGAIAKIFKIEGSINGKNKAPISSAIYTGRKIISDKIEDTKDFVTEQTEHFISKEFADINRAGLDEATASAMFAATLSVAKNTVLVCKDETDVDEALKQVLVDTSTAAILGYATGTVKEVLDLNETSNAYLIVNAGAQISKHMMNYVNGETDTEQLVENIVESSAYLVSAYAGKCVGKIIGDTLLPGVGGYIGQYVGEMITTAVCAEVMTTIKEDEKFRKQNEKMISLYKRAECEIRESQERLKELAEKENNELIEIIQTGFDEIKTGIENNSYEKIKIGLATIGSKFGFEKTDFEKEFVSKDSLFSNEVIMFD